MASKFQFITELYRATLAELTGDYESWTGFLRAACYNYKCPFDEQVLIYAQRPNATAVLELEKWNRQFGRWVNAGATGIAVIDEAHGKGRLKHYFDIADTHVTRISRPVPIWSMEPAYTERIIETLEATFGTLAEKDTLPDAILSASRNAVADNMPDYLWDLLDCRNGSMLEELDALNVEVTYRRALESSVAYMLMTRLSLPAMVYLLPEDFEGIYSFDTPSTINALGIATSDIAEMGLREISRTVMQARREQFFAKDAQIGYDAVKEQNNAEKERSAEHGGDLQSAGGLSPAEPADAPGAGNAPGQVRGAAETVSDAAPESAVYQPQDQRPTGGTSGGDRGDSAADGDAGRGADGEGRGRDGGAESRRSPALDGPDEQSEAQRGGNGAERPDLQLIREEPAGAGSDALPAPADDWTNLYHVAAYHHFENGFDDKLDYPTLEEAEAAAQGYVAGTMEADGFAYDGAAVYDADTNVCLRVYGDYPDERAQAQAAIYAAEHDRDAELPAFLDEHLIEAILLDDGGRKHTRQEIFAYFQANRNITSRTEFLKNSYNDIWVEVLAGTDKIRVGYHAQQDGLLMWEGSYLSRTSESVFSWGVVTEMTEGLIERGEYKIKLGLQNTPVMAEQLSFFDMGGGAAVYEVPEPQRTGELFPTRTVPQAVIDQALYTAGNSRGSAERIAVFYMRQRPETECAAFLRREFGTENGRGIEYDGQKYAVWFMEDGIHLAQGDSIRTVHNRTTVMWEQASARILELLEAGTYLSAAELAQARDKVLFEMGDALLMTARDLTEEGRAQGLFTQTLTIHDQRKGYPELDEDMVAFAKGEGGLAALAEEYHAFLSAYEQDHSIMRFRLSGYCAHRIGIVLDGLNYPERSFTAQPDFLRQCKMFITQDEIDRFFLADDVDSRLDVYAFFCNPHTKEEQQKFIKNRFGEYSGGGRDGYDYCIQPGVRSDDSSNYVQGSSGCWYNLPAAVQSGIALALACGYPSAEYGTAYGDSNSSDIIGAEKWAATQAVIWDLICEYRSPYDYRSWGSSPFYNCVDTSRYPTFALWYSEIVDAMQSATDIPSFAATSSRWCDTIELTKDSSGNYSASVTDTNGVLPDFNFSANSGNGITFIQRGNTLTITATPEAAKGLSTEKTYSATGSAYGIDPDEAVLCWYDSTGKYQSLASYTGTGLDPVRAYIKIKATVADEVGSLTINKTDADTGKSLAGVTYRLYDSAGNKIVDATTGANGKAVFSDLPLGSYSYQEISAPEGYVVDDTKYPITITASALDITATRTNALGKAGVEISKVDADSKSPLQGAGFRLYDASGSQVAEGYTDANGKLSFTGLKLGSYTCKEFQAPTGYELDETAFPVTLNQNEQVLKVTRENKLITGSIEILKVDADTKQPLSGVVYRLFDTEGNKIADGTTDANGKLIFDNLKPGSYSYQEISTVDGYQLDETKYDFSLTSENLNVKVTRENKPVKGCLTVRKVDVTGSPLAGAELLLETSTDGQTWAEVSIITTDKTGVAKWDNLKIGVQYRIIEVKAPAGYTLMTEPLFTGTLDNTNPDVTITACNSAGFVLPFTGGVGFTPYILFAALMLCMGVYFCKKSEFTKETTR